MALLVSGGRLVRNMAQRSGKGGYSVDVGFFSSAKYQDGTPVALVAAVQEFGARGKKGRPNIPERPFFRNALKEGLPDIERLFRQSIDPKRMVISKETAAKAGLVMQSKIQNSIRNLRTPENAPATIERKGSSNPLIDTGLMRESASFQVVKNA